MENFVLRVKRNDSQFRPVMLSESTYSLLQATKEKTNVPIVQIVEQAINYAMMHLQIIEED